MRAGAPYMKNDQTYLSEAGGSLFFIFFFSFFFFWAFLDFDGKRSGICSHIRIKSCCNEVELVMGVENEKHYVSLKMTECSSGHVTWSPFSPTNYLL